MNITDAKKVVIDNLNNKLQGELSHQQIVSILNETISSAYEKIGKEDESTLYRQLSLLLHPDKIGSNDNRFVEYLVRCNKTDVPQKTLQAIQNNKNIFNTVRPDFLINKFIRFVKAIWTKQNEYPTFISFLTKTAAVVLSISVFLYPSPLKVLAI